MSFADHFSTHAREYARARPQYPSALFAYLADLGPSQDCAWDCATGHGQAALGLAARFRQVIATDASATQIANAFPHPRISYRVGPAEQPGLDGASVDLITIAQALHWFDLDSFYAAARRILRPGGVIAAWCYTLPEIAPPIDRALSAYCHEILGPYWSPRIRFVDEEYRTIPFPFPALPTPAFSIQAAWDLPALLGYLRSWSAARAFAERQGADPLDTIGDALVSAWGPADRPRAIRWPLYLRVGRTDS